VSKARKHRFRWTGELVDVLLVHDPAPGVSADAAHDVGCAVLATVRREDGRVTEVPFSTLTPVTAPNFSRVPVAARPDGRVAAF
jgi:hypothetical protein